MRANMYGDPVVHFLDDREMDRAISHLKKLGFKVYDIDKRGLRTRRITVKINESKSRLEKINKITDDLNNKTYQPTAGALHIAQFNR